MSDGDTWERLNGLKTYEQRTPEWYAIRNDLLTASDAAAALGIRPYESYRQDPREELMKRKLGLVASSFGSAAMQHGVDNEDVARRIYCERTGEDVREYGLVIHRDHPWLGASPDGVTRSGKLVEIKCPVSREVVPGYVPEHYVPQIQVCMEVLDLEETIFIQYKPEAMMWPKPEIFDVTIVPRDRAWFAEKLPVLHAFFLEMMERRKSTVLPIESTKTATKPRAIVKKTIACSIVDDLYPDEVGST
jgi:putative phage-type endonuclease